MVKIEWVKLLERVSADERGLRVGVQKVDTSPMYRHGTEKKREKARAFIEKHAPEGVLRAQYWLDGTTGRVRSRPNLELLHSEAFEASPGKTLVELSVGAEVLCHLRDCGEDALADCIVKDRVRLWDLLVTELATEEERDEGAVFMKALRQEMKVAFFRVLYGMQPPEDEPGQAGLMTRIVGRWPGVLLVGTKEGKRATLARRQLRTSGVWLDVALEAERLGCRVAGFWLSEPVLEVGPETDASAMTFQLEEYANGLL